MSKELRRVVSSSDIVRDTMDDTSTVYRAPIRDALGEDQSILDRSSIANGLYLNYDKTRDVVTPTAPAVESMTESFNKFDIGIHPSTGAVQKRENSFHNKPSRVTVYINQFEDGDDKESIDTWMEKFELMAETNGWTEENKRNYLMFNLGEDAFRYVIDLKRENDEITFDQIKQKLKDRFQRKFSSSIDYYNMSRRRFKKGERFITYWNDKIDLMRRVDPNMSFYSKRNHIIDSLDYELFGEVLKYTHLNEPSNMDELFHVINNLNQIEISSKTQRELNQRSVRFDDKPFQNNRQYNRNNGNNDNFHNRRPFNRPNNFRNNYDRRNETQQRQTEYKRYDRRPNRPESSQLSIEGRNSSKERNEKPNYSRSPENKPICFVCNKPGHLSYSCPNKDSEN